MSFDPDMQAIMDTIADQKDGRDGKRARFAAIWARLDGAAPVHRSFHPRRLRPPLHGRDGRITIIFPRPRTRSTGAISASC